MSHAPLSLPPSVQAFVDRRSVVTVATASRAAVPRAGSFLYVNDGADLYFWTRPETTTARHVEQNPSVAFVIDGYDENLGSVQGLQGMGECTVLVDGRRIAEIVAMFGAKYPSLSPGGTLSISFFRIAPTSLEFVDNTRVGAAVDEGDFGAAFHREHVYSVFEELPRAAVDRILGMLASSEFATGEVIVHQGDPSDRFFIIVDGEVEIVHEGEHGERVVATLQPGHFFGEIGVLRDVPRAATARASLPTKLLSMGRSAFRDLVAQSLGATADFDEVVRARLRSVDPVGS